VEVMSLNKENQSMTKEAIRVDVEKICREVFDNDSVVITEETSADDIEEWDSFAHVNLIMSIEKYYGVSFALGELQDLRDVGELIHLIKKKTGEAK